MKKLIVVLALSLSACALFRSGVDTTCKIVDTAHDVCTVIRYLGPDGKVHEEKVTAEEMAAFGKQLSAKRAATAADGGTQ